MCKSLLHCRIEAVSGIMLRYSPYPVPCVTIDSNVSGSRSKVGASLATIVPAIQCNITVGVNVFVRDVRVFWVCAANACSPQYDLCCCY